jgi:hypothetical protein
MSDDRDISRYRGGAAAGPQPITTAAAARRADGSDLGRRPGVAPERGTA